MKKKTVRERKQPFKQATFDCDKIACKKRDLGSLKDDTGFWRRWRKSLVPVNKSATKQIKINEKRNASASICWREI